MKKSTNTLRKVLTKCFPIFVYAGLFSFILNVLALGTPLYMLTVFDRVLSSRSNETLIVLSGIFGFALAIESYIENIRTRLFSRLGDIVFFKLRNPVVQGVLRYQQGNEYQSYALEDLTALKEFLAGSGLRAAFEIPWIPLFLFVLWMFHPILSIIALVSALILFALTYAEEIITKANQTRAGQKERQSKDFIAQASRNAEVLSALSMTDRIRGQWETVNDEFQYESLIARKKISAIHALSKFMRGALRLVSMGTAAFLVINVEGVTPGVMLASTIILGKTTKPILTVITSWRSFIMVRQSYHRLEKLFEMLDSQKRGFKPPAPKGKVSVESLLFFVSREKTILNGINFHLEPGEALGIIGTSGSGKTTLARLLVGILHPSDGAIRLDGAEVSRWSANGLGEWVGYLPQDQQLFQGTVAENICRMDKAFEHVEEVVAAARKAGVHDLMLRLLHGYDTEVGPGGCHLSGGQRQLIALARAIYGNPRLVVFDEPNTFLDGNSEVMLLELIQKLKQDRVTQIIITHKPSILQDVDKILVLGQSKQLMFGPRHEILQRLNTGPDVVPLHGDRHAIKKDAA